MNLLIVESPGKVKKIQGFLGDGWKVAASKGHVRDLPKDVVGVYPPDFVPQYVSTKQDVLDDLAKLVKQAEAVYLATDPDREGEGIAWHLQDALKLKNPYRVTYTEVTETAVKKALEQPRKIDMNLVKAQESRRVLDRLVGYPVSNAVKSATGRNLTAGRVQSPALRLVVEREAVIRNFKSTTYFGVELVFEAVQHVTDGWKAVWNTKDWLEDGQEYFLDKALAEKIAALRTLTVATYEESEAKQAPPTPFTTSSLQQAASNTLKFNPKRTMDLAQELYQDGHITYMRTDSPNLSEEAIVEIRSMASNNDWPVPPKPRTWKSKEGAQEAHEAIRPVHFEIEEAGSNDDEKALYRMIRLRTLASQLEDAFYAATKAVLETELDGKKVVFEAKGRRLTSPGWRVVMDGDQTEDQQDGESEPENSIPKLREGAQATALAGDVKTKKTNPPARYTQAALIRELEKRGIGRPSTYATIMDKITTLEYWVENKKRQLEPTPTGELLISYLVGRFGFTEYDFTKNIELKLDDVAEGKDNYLSVVSGAYGLLDKELSSFIAAQGIGCPTCGKRLDHLEGISKTTKKPFNFWACCDKACGTTLADNNGKPGSKREAPQLSEHNCPDCGKPLIHQVKVGEGGYNFWGCSGFKDGSCISSFADDDGKPGEKNVPKELPPSEYKCPKCKKPIYRRQGTSQKTNKPYDFYGCSNRACNAIYNVLDDGKPDFDAKKKGGKK